MTESSCEITNKALDLNIGKLKRSAPIWNGIVAIPSAGTLASGGFDSYKVDPPLVEIVTICIELPPRSNWRNYRNADDAGTQAIGQR
jgi:hypothetical protein